MNRLWVRLTLAFGLVSLVGIGTIALLVDWQAGSQVRQYLARQEMLSQSGLLSDLAAFYGINGGWQGVDAFIASYEQGRGSGAGYGRGRPPVLLADAEGRILFDERGLRTNETLTTDERNSSLPILRDRIAVGYLVVPATGSGGEDPAAGELLDNLRTVLMVAALVATALSLLAGATLGRFIAAPLRRMAEGARSFSRRQWTRRIPEHGSSETIEVSRALNEMAASLEQAETLRRNLTADIAHELRTPLAVMQGNLRAMLDGVYPLTQAEIAVLFDETRLLSRLVDDLRELSLAESREPQLRCERLDLAGLVESAADSFAAAADAHTVVLERELPGAEIPVSADPDRLRQVLVNLIVNALQHTPEGGRIILRAAYDTKTATVSVTDTGKGISRGDLTRVFDRFYRVESSGSGGSAGTGLGLAVAKAWVEAMGGRIGVESRVGEGSRFWFTVPTAT
ncbi:MAG: ATP-binding protein [Anaerolineales bacterium]